MLALDGIGTRDSLAVSASHFKHNTTAVCYNTMVIIITTIMLQ